METKKPSLNKKSLKGNPEVVNPAEQKSFVLSPETHKKIKDLTNAARSALAGLIFATAGHAAMAQKAPDAQDLKAGEEVVFNVDGKDIKGKFAKDQNGFRLIETGDGVGYAYDLSKKTFTKVQGRPAEKKDDKKETTKTNSSPLSAQKIKLLNDLAALNQEEGMTLENNKKEINDDLAKHNKRLGGNMGATKVENRDSDPEKFKNVIKNGTKGQMNVVMAEAGVDQSKIEAVDIIVERDKGIDNTRMFASSKDVQAAQDKNTVVSYKSINPEKSFFHNIFKNIKVNMTEYSYTEAKAFGGWLDHGDGFAKIDAGTKLLKINIADAMKDPATKNFIEKNGGVDKYTIKIGGTPSFVVKQDCMNPAFSISKLDCK